MSDIFEIKTKQISFKIGGTEFPLKDPKMLDKMTLKKDWSTLEKEKSSMDEMDYFLKVDALNKKTLRMFFPTISDEFIDDNIPSSALGLIIEKVSQLAEKHFGAVIEQAEKK